MADKREVIRAWLRNLDEQGTLVVYTDIFLNEIGSLEDLLAVKPEDVAMAVEVEGIKKMHQKLIMAGYRREKGLDASSTSAGTPHIHHESSPAPQMADVALSSDSFIKKWFRKIDPSGRSLQCVEGLEVFGLTSEQDLRNLPHPDFLEIIGNYEFVKGDPELHALLSSSFREFQNPKAQTNTRMTSSQAGQGIPTVTASVYSPFPPPSSAFSPFPQPSSATFVPGPSLIADTECCCCVDMLEMAVRLLMDMPVVDIAKGLEQECAEVRKGLLWGEADVDAAVGLVTRFKETLEGGERRLVNVGNNGQFVASELENSAARVAFVFSRGPIFLVVKVLAIEYRYVILASDQPLGQTPITSRDAANCDELLLTKLNYAPSYPVRLYSASQLVTQTRSLRAMHHPKSPLFIPKLDLTPLVQQATIEQLRARIASVDSAANHNTVPSVSSPLKAGEYYSTMSKSGMEPQDTGSQSTPVTNLPRARDLTASQLSSPPAVADLGVGGGMTGSGVAFGRSTGHLVDQDSESEDELL